MSERCKAERPADGVLCNLDAPHEGRAHEATGGPTWVDVPARCGELLNTPAGLSCELGIGHEGACVSGTTSWNPRTQQGMTVVRLSPTMFDDAALDRHRREYYEALGKSRPEDMLRNLKALDERRRSGPDITESLCLDRREAQEGSPVLLCVLPKGHRGEHEALRPEGDIMRDGGHRIIRESWPAKEVGAVTGVDCGAEPKRSPQGRCETTGAERFANPDCRCATYEGNLGPCGEWLRGGNGRCVYCDHEESCHEAVRARWPGGGEDPADAKVYPGASLRSRCEVDPGDDEIPAKTPRGPDARERPVDLEDLRVDERGLRARLERAMGGEDFRRGLAYALCHSGCGSMARCRDPRSAAMCTARTSPQSWARAAGDVIEFLRDALEKRGTGS